ncbi:hypothetical protein BJX66DRAFT_330150 [Aspergillus keveii]|uniref:Uncharacterized protein n=1 Tax=Aspergillus keveii TaxID=714993 RepID=A0ABR4FLN2_9EURO
MAEVGRLFKENAVIAPLMWHLLIQPEVPRVTYRIRTHVLNGHADEAGRLKESFKEIFALEAVAAAIIAQIAITALSLGDFGNIHWTASAFAYSSLVSGVLSTYYSFYVQQLLSSLHTSEDVREWLLAKKLVAAPEPPSGTRGRRQLEIQCTDIEIPSATAAALLTAPTRLLMFSVMFLFLALGVYLACMYSHDLGNLRGYRANLAVLVFFIIISIFSIWELLIPLSYKDSARWTAHGHRDGEELRDIGVGRDSMLARENRSTIAASSREDLLQEGLKASIRAQEESLKAQKALLDLLHVQVLPPV